jgi:hypothetical protein
MSFDDDDDEDGDGEAVAPPPPRRAPPPPIFQPPATKAAKAPAAAQHPARAAAAAPVTAAAPVGAALSAPLGHIGLTVVPAAAFDAGSPDHAAILDRIAGWHQTFAEWPALDAASLGVVHRPEAGDLAILIELGVLAVVCEGVEVGPQILAFAKKLQTADFFAILIRGGGFEAALESVEGLADEPWAAPFFERLVHARAIAQRANAKIDLLYQLKQVETARAALDLVREHLVGSRWREAPFFVVRALVRLGILALEPVRGATIVPSRRLIANAARLGIARTERLDDFASLVALAETVAALFGDERFGYGLALERLDLALG